MFSPKTQPPPARPADMDTVWCPACGMWLPGPEQFKDHVRGRKHKRAAGTYPGRPHTSPAESMARNCARKYLLLLSLRIPRQLEHELVLDRLHTLRSTTATSTLATTIASLP